MSSSSYLCLFIFPLILRSIQCSQFDDCCRVVMMTSRGAASSHQHSRLGVYTKQSSAKLNNHPVYKNVLTESFIYRWYFGSGKGSRWVVGETPTSDVHSIEVEGEGEGLCVDQLGPALITVRAGEGWLEDETVKISCIDPQYRRTLREEGAGPGPGGCCDQVRVSSNDVGQQFQPGRMSVYRWNSTTRPTINSYPAYTNSQGQWLYLWDWGRGQGINWFISGDPTSNSRGVESPDMERKISRCPEKINIDRVPWKVFTTARRVNMFDPRTGWREDEGLRVECWQDRKNETCCDRLSIRSEGEAAEWQPDKMGSYSVWGSSGGRKVWKHESRQNYLYYWEWGVNTGTEWMVGHSPFSSVRGIRSDNLEGLGSRAICFDDAEVVGDWYVHTEDNIWVTDNSLTIQCEASDQ